MGEPILEVRDVTKRYGTDGTGQLVLDRLSLAVDAGELVSIVGPSGCGKTTLLNLIGALDRPDGGSLLCCGTELVGAGRRALTDYRAHAIGFVFQFYNLLPTLTAAENVVAGLVGPGVGRAEARRRAAEMLERVGLAGHAGRFPTQMSGGEQQRVAIARALVKRPRLVLADEPTGNLDEDASAQVMALVRELNAETGVTFLVVTHDPAVSAETARTVRLEHGRIAEVVA